MGNLEESFSVPCFTDWCQIGKPEYVAQEGNEPFGHSHLTPVEVGSFPALAVKIIEIVCDAPEAGNFFLDGEGFGEVVVCAFLIRLIQASNGLQVLGRQYAPFDPECGKAVTFTLYRHGQNAAAGMKT